MARRGGGDDVDVRERDNSKFNTDFYQAKVNYQSERKTELLNSKLIKETAKLNK